MENPTILVADGDPKNLQILRESLESTGFSVMVAADGMQAWERVSSAKPDLILSEVNLPKLDGFQLLEKLKADSTTSSIPLMFLTNRRDLQDRVRSLRGGVKDYMIKPLHVKEVLARIKMILRRTERIKEDDNGAARKLSGRLEEFSPVELIESFGIERKTGVLTLSNRNNRRGEIYFRDGAVVNASLGNLKVEKAVYQMLPWTSGHFTMVFKDINVPDEISVSNLGLLLQGYKRMEEREKLFKKLPSPEVVFRISNPFRKIIQKKPLQPDVAKFISLINSKRDVFQIIDESDYDDIKTLERLVKLYEQNLIAPSGHAQMETHPGDSSEQDETVTVVESPSDSTRTDHVEEPSSDASDRSQPAPPESNEDMIEIQEVDEPSLPQEFLDISDPVGLSASEDNEAGEEEETEGEIIDLEAEVNRPWVEQIDDQPENGKITVSSTDDDEPTIEISETTEGDEEPLESEPDRFEQEVEDAWQEGENIGELRDSLAPLELEDDGEKSTEDRSTVVETIDEADSGSAGLEEREPAETTSAGEVEQPEPDSSNRIFLEESEQEDSVPQTEEQASQPAESELKEVPQAETVVHDQPSAETPAAAQKAATDEEKPADEKLEVSDTDRRARAALTKVQERFAKSSPKFVIIGRKGSEISAFHRNLVGSEARIKTFESNTFQHLERGEGQLEGGLRFGTIGISVEQQFTKLMQNVAQDLLGYVLLVEANRREDLSYMGYLLGVLKANFAVPFAIAATTDKGEKALSADALRDLLNADAGDYLQSCNPHEAESVAALIEGLASDANLSHCVPQEEQ